MPSPISPPYVPNWRGNMVPLLPDVSGPTPPMPLTLAPASGAGYAAPVTPPAGMSAGFSSPVGGVVAPGGGASQYYSPPMNTVTTPGTYVADQRNANAYVAPSTYGGGGGAPAAPTTYRSSDGLVTYNQWGQRLDSLGHVATSGRNMARSDGSVPGAGAPAGTGYAGLPANYTTALRAIYGDPALYYTDARGGEQQATQDYQTLLNYLSNVYGRYPTDDELNRALSSYQVYALGLNRPPVASDMFEYLSRLYRRPITPPTVNYLGTGEI